jgi:hypothetical protein
MESKYDRLGMQVEWEEKKYIQPLDVETRCKGITWKTRKEKRV